MLLVVDASLLSTEILFHGINLSKRMATSLEVTSGKHAVRAVILARPEAIRRVALLAGARRYLEEFEFRFNRRTAKSRALLFQRALSAATLGKPPPYWEIVGRPDPGAPLSGAA